MIAEQRVTIKMSKLHYQGTLFMPESRLQELMHQGEQKQYAIMLFSGMGETIHSQRSTFHTGSGFLALSIPHHIPNSQSCWDEFCFLITVSAKLPLR